MFIARSHTWASSLDKLAHVVSNVRQIFVFVRVQVRRPHTSVKVNGSQAAVEAVLGANEARQASELTARQTTHVELINISGDRLNVR